MSDQRPVFRFRLPWLTPSAPAQAPSLPRAPASRPAANIQIPAQPTAAAPVVRPPFRPAGVAPQPPPPPPPRPFRVLTPPRTGPQPSSASQAGSQTRDPTQLSSPTRAAAQVQVPFPPPPPPPPPSQIEAQPRRAEPQPSSQSLFGPQTRIASQPTSPARTATQSRSAASQPPPPSTESRPSSPSRVASQLSSPAQAVSQPLPSPPPVQESPRRVESQPSPSSYRAGAQNGRISSPQASPARAGTQSRAASQSQPPPPPRNQSHPNSPSRFGAQTRVPSQPLSPAKASVQAAQTRAASQPHSPARVTPPPQVASPVRVVPQPQAPSKPSSPARPNPQAASQASSPSRSVAQPRAASPPSPPSHTTPLKDKLVAQLPSPPRTVQPTTQPRLSPPPVSGKESSNPMVVQPQSPVKDIDAHHVEPKKHSVIELLTEASSRLKAQTKELSAFAYRENHVENQESLGTKETVPTLSFGERQAKPVFSRPKDRNPVIDSHQKPSVQKDIRDDISKFVNKVSNGNTMDNDDKKPLSVITIAGDNRGATMTLGSSKRERKVHIHRGYKLNPDETTESTTDGEGTSKGKKISKDKEEETTKSCINNNSQGINNSIVFNSSVTEHNPGVHMVIYRSPKEPNKSNDRIETLLRAEMNFTPSQRLTYEPTIRRRCLRGLMMEPRDSDNDNPEKPRRHGCPYARGEMSEDDNNIDVL